MSDTKIPTTGGKPYCEISSGGCETNLQLYALVQACREWRCLQGREASFRAHEYGEARIRERLVLIVATLGLSLSQLLGQNAPRVAGPASRRVPGPRDLLDDVLAAHPDRGKLSDGFSEFVRYYDDCRHFGPPKQGCVTALGMGTCRRFVELALDIWDAVIEGYRDKHRGEADVPSESIRETVDALLDYGEMGCAFGCQWAGECSREDTSR